MRPGQDHARAVQHGTLAYMPPELILEDAISFATDVYSFGILLWEMFSMKVGAFFFDKIKHCSLSVCQSSTPVLYPASCACAHASAYIGTVDFLSGLQTENVNFVTLSQSCSEY